MAAAVSLNLNLTLVLNHVPFSLYGEPARRFLRKGRGESQRHVMMKWLGFLLFYHPELQIEASASQHYKPDLLRLDERGQPLQWIDCGQTSLQKLDSISVKNRLTYIDIIKATRAELEAYKVQADTRLRRPERVRYWAFEDHLVEQLGELLQRRHEIVATITQDFEQLYLRIDDRHELSTAILWLGEAESPAAERARELATHHAEL